MKDKKGHFKNQDLLVAGDWGRRDATLQRAD
jgi:hypothetical protein